jgi:hypothetical protein
MKIFNKNLKWNDLTKDTLGLPRPSYDVPEEYRYKEYNGHDDLNKIRILNLKQKVYLHRKIPVPWNTAPKFMKKNKKNLSGFFEINIEKEKKVLIENICMFCGKMFYIEENAIRYRVVHDKIGDGTRFIFSDISPYHEECMRQIRIYCPFMRTREDNEFESGKNELLKLNALNQLNLLENNN